MSINNIIDFPTFRSNRLQRSRPSQSNSYLHLELPEIPEAALEKATGTSDSALVAGLVIRLVKLNGRHYDGLPPLVRIALDDLCADGDSTCRLVRCWLMDEALVDQPPASPLRPGCQFNGVFRHNRFWRPDSVWLRKADDRRRQKLEALLAKLESGE